MTQTTQVAAPSEATTTTAATTKAMPRSKQISTVRWMTGLAMASVFSLVYLLTPLYTLSAMTLLLFQYPTRFASLCYGAPLLVSLLVPATYMPSLAKYLTPILDYFDYEEILECGDEELRQNVKAGKNFIFSFQPHGVISYCSMCAWINAAPDMRIKTAVASVLLQTPILKNVMGIFGLVPVSGSSIRSILQTKGRGMDGCIVLYVGGIAELFKSSRKEERLYLKSRKGFIKVALREGADVMPCYLFGNTSVLTVVKNGVLANLSRKLQVSLTYYWGKWLLPIPRDEKLLYVRGKPMGLPHIANPSDEDVTKWHNKYCEEVTRLFNSYKEKVPAYKHKTLYID